MVRVCVGLVVGLG